MTSKLVISLVAFSSCGGCLTNTWKSRLRNTLKYQSVVDVISPTQTKPTPKMDVTFIEGSIATLQDQEELQRLRQQSKKIILLGGCAINGWPSTQRNHLTANEIIVEKKSLHEQLPAIKTPSEIIKVDGQLRGCPIDEQQFDHLMNRLLVDFGIMEKKGI